MHVAPNLLHHEMQRLIIAGGCIDVRACLSEAKAFESAASTLRTGAESREREAACELIGEGLHVVEGE